MKKIRVLCFLERWESGGIESFLNSLFENIDLNKFEIDIVAARLGESVFTDRLRDMGIGFFELSGRLRDRKNRAMFRRLLAERHYDVLHLNVFHALAFAYAKDAAKLGVKVRIAHAHGAGLRRSFFRPIKLILHRFGRHVYGKFITKRLACSTLAADFLFGKSADEVVKNGIDLDRFLYSERDRLDTREALNIAGSLVIGTVARLSWEKNQELLLRAMPTVLSKYPEAKLLIVGEGPDETMLRALAEELSVSRSVIFFGTSDNIPALLSAMDIFVLPSRFEGLGIAAIEAQCSGLPTLLSSTMPSEAHATDLAESFTLTPEALAEKIISKLDNPTPRRSRKDELRLAGYSDEKKAEIITRHYEGVRIDE